MAGTETGARLAHSLHAYFLQPGNPKHDVIYKVRDTSDRRSFASRTVEAVQRGEVIFKMGASFCNARERHGAERWCASSMIRRPNPAKVSWV